MASAFCRSFQMSGGIGSPVRRNWSALTSYSWKSKSAPAARRTLIASGTTSLPAPSQGRTAMCRRARAGRIPGRRARAGRISGSDRGGFLFAQFVALDLARHGLWQLRHELDHVRVLKTLQAGFAVPLELDHERFTGDRVGLGDDIRLDLREPVDVDADDRALGHRLVLEQRRLDLDRRNPQAADLDHVVGSALIPVVAVAVDAVAVAGEKPVAEDAPLRLLVLRPVKRERAVALDVQVAGI